jgi:hypothetical protein
LQSSESARAALTLEAQREAFRKKSRRDWKPGDPADANQPIEMSSPRMQADVLEAMRSSGAPPQII